MARSTDAEKLDAWRRRLARFDAGGLSVAAFCRQEGITPARFYYWSPRVREAGSHPVSKNDNIAATSSRELATAESTVEVHIGGDVKVRLPGDDRELIKFVLLGLQSSTAPPAAFERIELSDSLVARR